MIDVMVIGSGPAGASLALYLKRDNYKVTVLTTDNSMLKKAASIENYYGVGKISGDELYNRGIKQLENIGIDVIREEVVKIEKLDSFKVYTDKNEYDAKVVVLAIGVSRTSPKISNISEYEGKGVSYCATCDGFFFRNKKIGVVGNGNLAYEEAKYLKQLSPDITLFTNGEELKRDFSNLNINIITNKIANIKGDQRVTGLILDTKENIELDGLFIAVGIASASTFSKTLGIGMNNNFIKVDDNYMTNINGLYAIGDVIGGTLQVGKAVSDGIVASRVINKFLKDNA
jgi:thioredoxin reductase (NADPH)